MVKPADWYYGVHGWPERTTAYLEGALALFIEAAGKALDRASITADAVDTIVTVSSTGIATPSLEARAMRALGFRSDVRRVPVFGLGCAGGVAGLSIGADLAMARPGSVVLVVAVELCSLAVRRDQPTKANMVALALFGDGAAAAVLTSAPGDAVRVVETGHHTWPDTLDIMGWKVDPVGFGVIFDQSIPVFARERLAEALDAILRDQSFCARRYRPLRLPSRWPQGARGHRRRSRPRAGKPRSRARGTEALRQHVRADRAVRTGARAAWRGCPSVRCCSPLAPASRSPPPPSPEARRERTGLARHWPSSNPCRSPSLLLSLCNASPSWRWLAEIPDCSCRRGAIEVAPEHYPAIVGMHGAWLLGLWLLAPTREVNLPLLGDVRPAAARALLGACDLGERWTTRIVILPGASLVQSGPYRFVSHPNYIVVAGEILVLPLVFGLVAFALLFSALNGLALWVRIRAEDAGLRTAQRRGVIRQ